MTTHEPKKTQLIAFVAIFLAAIYSVPIVQTAVEFFTNDNHHIQIADLTEDLFVTPYKKAAAARKTLDTVNVFLGVLQEKLRGCAAQPADSASPCDAAPMIVRADEALVNIRVLISDVVDYDRHIHGEKNRFAAKDTLKPYYRTLRRLEGLLDTSIILLQSGMSFDTLLPRVTDACAAAKEALTLYGPRNMAVAYPSLTLTAFRRIMVGADYLRPYEKEMEKSALFANALRPWMQTGYYLAFRDLGDKALLGKKGWLFYRPDVQYLTKPDIADVRSEIVDANDAPIKDAVFDTIKAFNDQLAGMGIDLVVVVMPGKPSIYPDLFATSMKPVSAGAVSHSTAFIDKLSKAGIATVDLFSVFAAERRGDVKAGDSLYLRTDTHFRSRAVTATARAVAGRLEKFAWFTPGAIEYGIDTLTVARNGDIAEMARLPNVNLPSLGLPFPAESTTCYRVVRLERNDSGVIIQRIPYRDDYRTADILVLGDSYSRIYQTDEPRSAGWISHLAREIRRPVASLVNDGGASTLVRQTLARKVNLLKGKKAVVWEIVERDLRFGAEGWKDVRLVRK